VLVLVCVNGIKLVCVFDDVVFMVCVSEWWLYEYCYSECVLNECVWWLRC